MTLSVTYRGTDITSLLRLEDGELSLTTAADGSTASGAGRVDDPAGSVTLLPLGEFIVEESACALPRCFTGTGLNFKINRGANFVAGGRLWDFDVFDLNELLKRRILRGSTANRPAETGSARIAWLLTTTGMSGVVFDNGKIAANAWTYEKTDFRGKYALDVLESIVSASGELGRVFFVYWDPVAGQPSLFYASPNGAINDSTLRISNVAADVDGTTTFAPYDGSELEAKGEAIYDGVYVTGAGNLTLYRQRASTFATYGVHVDGAFSWDRLTNLTYAAIHADTFLDRHAGQIDTINVTVRLPRAKVNLIDAGMRIEVKFSHLPGFTTFTWTRVTHRTIILTAGERLDYDVQLELSVRGLDQTGGGDPGGFPLPPTGIDVVQSVAAVTNGSGQITLPSTPATGNTLVAFTTRRGGATDMPTGVGWTEHSHGSITPGSDGAKMYYRPVDPADTATVKVVQTLGGWAALWEVSGTVVPVSQGNADVDTGTQPGTVDAGTVTPTAGATALILAGICVHCSDYGGNGDTTIATDAAFTLDGKDEVVGVGDLHPLGWAGHRKVTSASGTYGPTNALTGAGNNFGGWGGLMFAFVTDTTSNPPVPGQWVFGETPTPVADGTTVTFATAFPFADGSLKVRVDNMDQTPSIVSYNGAAGTFTLAFAPKVGWAIRVDYQGR